MKRLKGGFRESWSGEEISNKKPKNTQKLGSNQVAIQTSRSWTAEDSEQMYPAAEGVLSYNESQSAQAKSQFSSMSLGIAKRQATLKDAWGIPQKPTKKRVSDCFLDAGGAANHQDGFMRLGWHSGDWWKTKGHEKEQTQSEMNNRRYGGGFHTIDNEWCIRYTNRMFLSGPLDLYMWYHPNNKTYNSGYPEYRLESLLRVTFGRWQRGRTEISHRPWLLLQRPWFIGSRDAP